MDEKPQKPTKHIIRTSAQLSAYTQWISDCEEFLSGLDITKHYTVWELQELFVTWQNTQIENTSQTPALLRNLALQEKRREESYKIQKLQEAIVSLAENKNIIPPRDKERFFGKLFGIGSESTKWLYGQYENMQKAKTILAIVYLAKPYDIYMVFNKDNIWVHRYKLHGYNKKSLDQLPNYIIDEHVDLAITHEWFLHSMYDTYNKI